MACSTPTSGWCRHRERADPERAHYAKLIGHQITAIIWEEIEGRALPILLLNGCDRDGNAATATVLMDPEGNGPGHIYHNL